MGDLYIYYYFPFYFILVTIGQRPAGRLTLCRRRCWGGDQMNWVGSNHIYYYSPLTMKMERKECGFQNPTSPHPEQCENPFLNILYFSYILLYKSKQLAMGTTSYRIGEWCHLWEWLGNWKSPIFISFLHLNIYIFISI